MKTPFCLLTGLLLMLYSPHTSLAQSSASASAEVTLTIEEWAELSPTPPLAWNIVMIPVTPDWFCNEWETNGSLPLDVEANTDVTLRCPLTTPLGDGTPYTLEAAVSLQGINLAYHCGDYWCIDFAAGSHPNETELWVRLKKHWWVEDIAGTYHATVLLDLIPDP
jgi:hypothetical protein